LSPADLPAGKPYPAENKIADILTRNKAARSAKGAAGTDVAFKTLLKKQLLIHR
jgi:hypothetical protein